MLELTTIVPDNLAEFVANGLKKARLHLIDHPNTLLERLTMLVQPHSASAYWLYRDNTHYVFIGANILSRCVCTTADELDTYIANYAYHEMAHAKFTFRDLTFLKHKLTEINCPWSLFNLFEDARVEHHWHKLFSRKFNWLLYEKATPCLTPISLFHRLIQSEGKLPNAACNSLSEDNIKLVCDTYNQCVNTSSTLGLLPLLATWLAKFGTEKSEMPAEFAVAELLQSDDAALASLLETIKPPQQPSSANPATAPVSVYASDTYDFFSVAKPCPLAYGRINPLIAKLKPLLLPRPHLVATDVPTRRLCIQNYLIGKPAIYKKMKNSIKPLRTSIVIVVDCSGSMAGSAIEEGKVLLAALNGLTKTTQLTCHLILSGVIEGIARWQTLKLPIPENRLSCISGFASAEGLESAIANNKSLIQAADFVFVYTDGNIVDEPIDKSKLHQQGIYTWGLYIGELSASDNLLTYFDKKIVRHSAEALVEGLITEVNLRSPKI